MYKRQEETYQFKIKPNGIFIDDFNIISELILGGESKYGFGHVLLDSINEVNFPLEYIVESKNSDENSKSEIKIKCRKDESLLAHLRYSRKVKFKGDVELLTGRGYYDPLKLKNEEKDKNHTRPGEVISSPIYYFSPGTVLQEKVDCVLNWDGCIESVSYTHLTLPTNREV